MEHNENLDETDTESSYAIFLSWCRNGSAATLFSSNKGRTTTMINFAVLSRLQILKVALPLIMASSLLFCSRNVHYKEIDYQKRTSILSTNDSLRNDSLDLTIAVAPVVSTEESYKKYYDLFSYTASLCSLKIKTTYYKKNVEIYRLFQSRCVDVAFVSEILYVMGKRQHLLNLLVVPVRKGKPTHQAYIIAQKKTSAKTFIDLTKERFAFTDEFSFTGYWYPLSRSGNANLPLKQVFFSGSHDQSVYLVNRGLLDGASVDGYVYDAISKASPKCVSNTRVLEVSKEFGTQPIVISQQVSPRIRDAYTKAFLSLDKDSTGRKLLAALGIDEFITQDDSCYASISAMVPETIIP